MTILEERPLETAGTAAPENMARRAMIDSQLRVSGVNDPAILAAFAATAREDFVPAALRANAYIDRALPLEDGHMLPAPLVHGRMLSEAAPVPGETVLVISPSGYLAALVSALGCDVTSTAPADASKKGASANLILIDGAIEELPAGLAARLAENGRIVTGLVQRGVTRLASGTKVGGEVSLLPLAEMGIPVLAEFAAPRRWSF